MLWARWDLDGSGFVTRQEVWSLPLTQSFAITAIALGGLSTSPPSGLPQFLDPDTGLLRFVRTKLLARRAEPPPDASLREWFEYFDDDGTGTLTRSQVRISLTYHGAYFPSVLWTDGLTD